MPPKFLRSLSYLEFEITVAEQGGEVLAVGRRKDHAQVGPVVKAKTEAEAIAEVKAVLAKHSETYFGVEAALAKFRKVYPGGFADGYYLEKERRYKEALAAKFAEIAGPEAFAAAATSDAAAVALGHALPKLFNNDLLIAVEKGKLKGAILNAPAEFARSLGRVLHSEHPWTAFDAYAALLKRLGAGGWASTTYFPFCLDPSHWLLVRPQFVQDAAARLGYALDYSPEVGAPTYQRILAFADWVFGQIVDLAPRDRIDVYSFLYVTNADGYVSEVAPSREQWLAKQALEDV